MQESLVDLDFLHPVERDSAFTTREEPGSNRQFIRGDTITDRVITQDVVDDHWDQNERHEESHDRDRSDKKTTDGHRDDGTNQAIQSGQPKRERMQLPVVIGTHRILMRTARRWSKR